MCSHLIWGWFWVFLALLSMWCLGSFVRDRTCPLHWKHRVLSTGPPGTALSEDVNSLFYLKKNKKCCLLPPLSVCLSLCVNTIFPFNSYHVKDFNEMFSDPNCPCLLNSETLKTLWKCLSGTSAWWRGSFTVTFFAEGVTHSCQYCQLSVFSWIQRLLQSPD